MAYGKRTIAGRLLADDPEAVGEVIRWISTALTAPRYWSLRAEWPDLLQEVMARVLEALRDGRFDASRDLRVYVQGVARFVSLEELRRRRHVPLDEGDERTAGDPDPESLSIQAQLVHRVMGLASPDCRQLIGLYYLQSRSHLEIAAELGTPPGTVKSRLFRCLESVRKMVRQHHDGEPDREPA